MVPDTGRDTKTLPVTVDIHTPTNRTPSTYGRLFTQAAITNTEGAEHAILVIKATSQS